MCGDLDWASTNISFLSTTTSITVFIGCPKEYKGLSIYSMIRVGGSYARSGATVDY